MDEIREMQEVELNNAVSDLEAIHIRLGWVTRRRFEQELESFSLTAPQYMALHCIRQCQDGCSMSELAEYSHQVSATMTGIVDRLVERGLVSRERDPRDRRTLHVALTPEGERLMEQVSAHKRVWLRQFLAGFSPEERRSMIEMAGRYLEVVEQSLLAEGRGSSI